MDFLFIFKKLAALGLTPVGFTIEMIVIGLVLVGYSRRMLKKKPGPRLLWFKGVSGDIGTFLIGIACLFLYLCSTQTVAHSLASMLEDRYTPIDEVSSTPDYIVVLPGGYRYADDKPVFSNVERTTLVRLMRGIEYWRQTPEASMIFTGTPEEVESMSEIAIHFGVAPDKIIEESESRDTKDHPVYTRKYLEGKSFLLVTSGIHMPRSVALFRGQGLDPTPAPTDLHTTDFKSPFHPAKLAPHVNNLMIVDEVFHETFGIIWAAWRNQTEKRDKK